MYQYLHNNKGLDDYNYTSVNNMQIKSLISINFTRKIKLSYFHTMDMDIALIPYYIYIMNSDSNNLFLAT